MIDYAKMIDRLPRSLGLNESWGTLLIDLWQSNQRDALEILAVVTESHYVAWSLSSSSVENDDLWCLLAECFGQDSTAGLAAKKVMRKNLSIPASILEVLEKIQSIASDRGLNSLEILSEARVSSNLAAFLQKNATKTGPYEPLAVAFINARTGEEVAAFRLADAKTKLSIRFDSSGRAMINHRSSPSLSKDADIAIVRVVGKAARIWLVTHKFARVAGGHQDNQLADASTYLDFAAKQTQRIPELVGVLSPHIPELAHCDEISIVPAALLDGEYFQSRMPSLKAEFDERKVFIGTSDDFVNLC